MSDVEGTFLLFNKNKANYLAEIDILVNGVKYKAHFDGTCISEHQEQEVKTNYFIYNGEEFATTGATLTKGASVWSVEVVASNGKSAVLVAPQEFFVSGGTYGFSQNSLFKVICDGVTYSKESGSSGTATLKYDDKNKTLKVEFTNYDNLQFNYSGVVTVVE